MASHIQHDRRTRNWPVHMAIAAIAFASMDSALVAQDQSSLSLEWPVDCTLGSDCWIARYVDRGEGDSVADYSCGTRSQNDHKGTDIVVADTGELEAGVPVLAAAPGVVRGLRDGMKDRAIQSKTERQQIKGRECGNAVVVRHAGGWETQYCHLREGSVSVKRGQQVKAGDMIGNIGLSGLTEYPHLHFQVRYSEAGKQGRNIDPYDGGTFEEGCAAPEGKEPLWQARQTYQEIALVPPRLVATPLTRATMWEPQADLAATSPALLLQARGFHTKTGDVMRFTLIAPDGRVRLRRDMTLDRGFQVARPFLGIRKPASGFQKGRWRGTVELVRGDRSLGAATIETMIE